MLQNFYSKLENLLKKDSRFVDQDGDLLKSNVIDSAYKADKKLVELLLSEKEFKSKFFGKIKDVLVLNINNFVGYIQDKNFLADSYTKYRNKIGLNIDGKFLNERKEVALVWPFKDCILEGGMTKEDEKRKEIFFNEILAQDEIDKLFAPKVLTNWKRYTQKGEEKVKELKRDESGTIRENLIIKGNNLLALHSLKDQFQGRIKLIYIDPPYNIGKGDFGYNDNFNHSTWLTFMKNRLEIAKIILKSDGAIIGSCDDAEQTYLKVLMDDIFDRSNFLVNGVVNRASEIASEFIISKHEYFLVYARDLSKFKLRGRERYTVSRGTVGNEDQTMPIITFPTGLKCIGVKDGIYKKTRKIEDSNENIENLDPIIVKNGRLSKDVRLKAKWRSSNDMRNYFANNCKPTIAKINGIIEEIYFDSDRFMPQIKKMVIEKIPSLILNNKRGSRDLEDLDMSGVFKYPKAVDYLKQLISYITSSEDLVIDFFAGSGTTGQAVLELYKEDKITRNFILIEQLDEHIEICEKRIQKVIKKQENFVYCELMKYNEWFVEKIQKAKNAKELLKIWEEMKNKSFLNYNVDIKKFNKTIDEFKKLSLTKQKHTLFDLLNKNQLYVNLSEIEDKEFRVSEGDKKINKEFYG